MKVGFVLLSNRSKPVPSTRVAVLNMLPYLSAAGFDARILYEPESDTETPDLAAVSERILAQPPDVVIFQKVHGDSVLQTVRQLRERQVATVFSVCDLVSPAMAEATDATVIVTDFLRNQYPANLRDKIHVVHDGIERPAACKNHWGTNLGSRWNPLRAILVTSALLHKVPVLGAPPPWLHVTIMGAYASNPLQRLRETRWKMMSLASPAERANYRRFLFNPHISCRTWGPEAVYDALKSADIGIIPIDVPPGGSEESAPLWKVKSENRLTLKMSVGLPVIATPIPAYEPVIQQGTNGFLARERAEWLEYLEALRDPQTRERIGRAARDSVLHRYSMEEQARRLIAVLRAVVSQSAKKK